MSGIGIEKIVFDVTHFLRMRFMIGVLPKLRILILTSRTKIESSTITTERSAFLYLLAMRLRKPLPLIDRTSEIYTYHDTLC